MFDRLYSEPKEYFVTVICFSNDFSTLPVFYGSRLLVVDRQSQLLTQYRWVPENPLIATSEENLKLEGQFLLSTDSTIQALQDAAVTVVLASECHSDMDWLIDCLHLRPAQNSCPSLTILLSWPSIKPTINDKMTQVLDTVITVSNPTEAIELARPIIEVMMHNFMVAIDYVDVRMMFNDHSLLIAKGGYSVASGSNRAEIATKKALNTVGAFNAGDLVYVAIMAGYDLTLDEYSAICDQVENNATSSSVWVVGACIFDPMLEASNEIRVIVIVSSPTGSSKVVEDPIEYSTTAGNNYESGQYLDTPDFLRKMTTN